MTKAIKILISLVLLALGVACGGGGGGTTTTYLVNFEGTVTGLPSGQQLKLIGSLPTTGQSLPITISQNGAFTNQITLPAGFNLSNFGAATVTISQQPSGAICSISYATTSAITVNCALVSGAAGLYSGPFTTPASPTGRSIMFIQNNGNYWVIGGNATSGTVTYNSMISGTGTSTATTFTSNNGVDLFSSPQYVNDSISATYQSLSTFTGSLIEGTTSYSLNLTAVPGYSFNVTPSLSAVAGTYNLSLANKGTLDTSTISIGTTGSFNGTTAKGCSYTGNVTPMTSGENAYNFSINFGPSPCVNPSISQTGTIVIITTTIGTQLFGGVFANNLANATILIGTKQ